MVTEPGDELAAAAAARGHLRVSHAEREQVIDTLKASFVRGMLAKDELDLRVSRAFASRTYTELAAVTADLPSEPTAAQPPEPARAEGEQPVLRPGQVIMAAATLCASVWAFTFLPPWPANSEGDPPHAIILLFFLTNFICLIVSAIGVVKMIELRYERRSGRRPPRPPSAGPDIQLPPGDHGH